MNHASPSKLPVLSIVIPCYNEQANIRPFIGALEVALPIGYSYQLLFVDDGSSDGTYEEIMACHPVRSDILLQPVQLARNFGKEVAVSAGLDKATGHAAIIIDCDLQHPPAEIPRFIDCWQQGVDIVIGTRSENSQYAPFVKRMGSKLFYKIINVISETPVTPHATDFRMIDRVVIDEYKRFSEHNRIARGLLDWLGFRREYIAFTPAKRLNGVASYSFRKLTGLALNSFVAMSFVPLKLAGYFGLVISVSSGLLGLLILFEMFVFNDPLGWRISNSIDLAVLIIFLIGVVLMALGLIALYIATIHTEVINRPLYVERKSTGPRPKPVLQ